MNNQNEIDKLLAMYNEYKNTANKISKLEPKVAKKKILKLDHKDEAKELEILQNKLQQISDEMTFANPIIWIGYKYNAYKDESQPILTLKDLIIHCSKPGYICTKRFNFLNQYLADHGKPTIPENPNFNEDEDLSKLLDSIELKNLTENPDFMKKWQEFEYFKDGGRTAKWENFHG